MERNLLRYFGQALFALTVILTALHAQPAGAQNSSLFRQGPPLVAGPPLTLANSSWYYQAVDPPKPIKLNDLITVVVDEKTQVVESADLQRRKQAQLNAELKNWVRLDGLNIRAAPQTEGNPHVNGTLQAQYRANADLQTQDSMKFRIAARVVDIRPNGHLVIEAHQSIRNNEERWERALSGVVRPEDVLPNNTVLSEHLAELSIQKREQGQIRDGYRRGWILKLLDKYGLF